MSKGRIEIDGEWTEEDIRKMVVNPVYTGIGPYPRTLDDDLWIRCATRVIKEEGAHYFLRTMLDELRACLVMESPK